MNKQIQELAFNAAKATGVNLMIQDPKFVEKFAELIVKECANLSFRSTGHVTSDGEQAIGELIVDHFGFGE